MVPFEKYTLINDNGMEATLLNPGLILQSLKIPIGNALREVTLGFTNPLSYFSPKYVNNYPYLGAIIGRIANRIRNASFSWEGNSYSLFPNDGLNCLHGGNAGFDKRWWQPITLNKNSANFSLYSADGEENFPGELNIRVDIWLSDQNDLGIKFTTYADRPSPVNLTWHPYFNLDAHHISIKEHFLKINAAHYLETDEYQRVTGIVLPNMWGFDKLCSMQNTLVASGLDHSFILSENIQSELIEAAVLQSKDQDLEMKVYTNNPIVHVYIGQHLPKLTLHHESELFPMKGMCFECQLFTDFVNHAHFPQLCAYPDNPLVQETVYSFTSL